VSGRTRGFCHEGTDARHAGIRPTGTRVDAEQRAVAAKRLSKPRNRRFCAFLLRLSQETFGTRGFRPGEPSRPFCATARGYLPALAGLDRDACHTKRKRPPEPKIYNPSPHAIRRRVSVSGPRGAKPSIRIGIAQDGAFNWPRISEQELIEAIEEEERDETADI